MRNEGRWHALARAEYARFRNALKTLPGTVYADADQATTVVRAALPGALAVYGWRGGASNAQTGQAYARPPELVLWQRKSAWYQITVAPRTPEDRAWDRAEWFQRAGLLHRASEDLRVFDDLVDMVVSLSNVESLPTWQSNWESIRMDHAAVVWGARQVMTEEQRTAAATLTALTGERCRGVSADPLCGVWEETAAGRRMIVEPAKSWAEVRGSLRS